jgi:MoxR-like ATPase
MVPQEMQIVLPEQPEWTDRAVTLKCEIAGGKLSVFHADDEKQIVPVLRMEIERRTRNLRLDIPKGDRVTLVTPDRNVQRFEGISNVLVPMRREAEDGEGYENADRNWLIEERDEGQVFKIWHPEQKTAIELPIVQPCSDTPVSSPGRYIHEPVGQQSMLFSLALGILLEKHTLLTGPTGIAKTTAYRWLASKLGYNLVIMPITRGTQDRHMIGEYMPAGAGDFPWVDGPITRAARLSLIHPTILLLDEINRIGNVAEFARCYSLLDDTRMLELPERRSESGDVETIHPGKLYIGATSNPCFTGDTLVAVADGRNAVPISQLAEEGADVDVYATAVSIGKRRDGSSFIKRGTVVKKMTDIRKTATQQKIVKIGLDDGSYVRCTSDHKFMLKNGSYQKAQLLKAGESLMRFDSEIASYGAAGTLRRRIWMGHDSGKNGSAKPGEAWRWQHRWIGQRMFGDWSGTEMSLHHKDLDPLNDQYFNLVLMSTYDHNSLHKRDRDPIALSAASLKSWSTRRARYGPIGSTIQTKPARDLLTAEELSPIRSNAASKRAQSMGSELLTEAANKMWETRRAKYGSEGHSKNHKVVSVCEDGVEDVYCGFVEEVHNFAIVTSITDGDTRDGNLSGVVVHNCDDDNGDYIGVRELDPALNSRLPIQPKLGYPDPLQERAVLMRRVPSVDIKLAGAMVAAANLIRQSNEVRYPISFRELEAWALLAPFMGVGEAAEVAVVSKAALHFRESVRGLIRLKVGV